MSYKCTICEKAQPAGTPVKRHTIRKEDGNIKQEMLVCDDCQAGLKSGYSLEAMRQIVGPKRERPEALRHLPAQEYINTPDPKPVSFRKKS